MRLNSAIALGAFIVIFVVISGCTSFGGNAGPTTQAPSVAASPGSVKSTAQVTMPPGLTSAQQTQATNIVKADATLKEVLGRQGYSISGIDPGMDAGTAIVTIMGSSAPHADGSLWTPDQYTATVDLNNNKILDTVHVSPKPLSTPKPSS